MVSGGRDEKKDSIAAVDVNIFVEVPTSICTSPISAPVSVLSVDTDILTLAGALSFVSAFAITQNSAKQAITIFRVFMYLWPTSAFWDGALCATYPATHCSHHFPSLSKYSTNILICSRSASGIENS